VGSIEADVLVFARTRSRHGGLHGVGGELRHLACGVTTSVFAQRTIRTVELDWGWRSGPVRNRMAPVRD